MSACSGKWKGEESMGGGGTYHPIPGRAGASMLGGGGVTLAPWGTRPYSSGHHCPTIMQCRPYCPTIMQCTPNRPILQHVHTPSRLGREGARWVHPLPKWQACMTPRHPGSTHGASQCRGPAQQHDASHPMPAGRLPVPPCPLQGTIMPLQCQTGGEGGWPFPGPHDPPLPLRTMQEERGQCK